MDRDELGVSIHKKRSELPMQFEQVVQCPAESIARITVAEKESNARFNEMRYSASRWLRALNFVYSTFCTAGGAWAL
jgi:hypothetical protein